MVSREELAETAEKLNTLESEVEKIKGQHQMTEREAEQLAVLEMSVSLLLSEVVTVPFSHLLPLSSVQAVPHTSLSFLHASPSYSTPKRFLICLLSSPPPFSFSSPSPPFTETYPTSPHLSPLLLSFLPLSLSPISLLPCHLPFPFSKGSQ